MATCEFYYDFSSPFSYLGATQIERVCRGHQLLWKPILLGGLFQKIGTPVVPLATFPEAKARHSMLDTYRWADHWGVPFVWPQKFPQKTVTALRLVLMAPPEEQGPLTLALFAAIWGEGGDLENPATLARVLESRKLDASAMLASTSSPEAKQKLFAANEEAFQKGVHGAPTCVVGDQVFWGQDRLHFVEKALAGWRPKVGPLEVPSIAQ